MLIGFMGAIASLMLTLHLEWIESDGRADYAKVLERGALLIFPLTFVALVALCVVYFFILHQKSAHENEQ